MADRNEAVMEMVRRELEADPEVGLDVLVQKAKEIDPAIADLSSRQFHARYPLQVKRTRSRGTRGKEKRGRKRAAKSSGAPKAAAKRASAGTPGSDRDAIRAVFLEFAGDFAKAESRQEIVGVLSSVDTYVDRVREVMGK